MGYDIFLFLLTISVIYEHKACFKTRCVYWEDIYESCSEIKWNYNKTIHQLLVDFKKVKKEPFSNTLIEFGHPRN
jgi:hypothetical protein